MTHFIPRIIHECIVSMLDLIIFTNDYYKLEDLLVPKLQVGEKFKIHFYYITTLTNKPVVKFYKTVDS